MFKFRHRAAVAALVCVCVLAACDDAPPPPPERAPAAGQAAPVSKKADLAQDMVAAVSAGKTSNLISVHFSLGGSPAVNTPLPVKVAIVPHRKFSSVRVHFESQDGLEATAGENFGPESNPAAETPLLHQLMLLPTREGMFVVTSSVETDSDDGNVTRIFSIPVIVASAAGPAAAASPSPEPAPEPAKN
jgi:hypothetical protein